MMRHRSNSCNWKWERFSYRITPTMSSSIDAPVLQSADIRLADLPRGTTARVVSVGSEASSSADLGRRLRELGFLPGEAVRIVAKGLMARAPIAVRGGTGTFALRLFEAACIRVRPEQQPA